MNFTRTGTSLTDLETGCLILGFFSDADFITEAAQADQATGGLLKRLKDSGDLPVKPGKSLMIPAPDGIAAKRLLLCGAGERKKFNRVAFNKVALSAGKALRDSRATSAHCLLSALPLADGDPTWATRQAALGLAHGDYLYTETKKPADDAMPATETVSFPEALADEKVLEQSAALAAGIGQCRHLGDLPPNICNPLYVAETAEKLAGEIDGLEVEILDEPAMEKLGMGALLAVGLGSENPSRLVVLHWKGAASTDEAPYVLVGKGITFDTGGISIKPREGMEEMKYDMCGAATAIGVIEAVARMGLKLNVSCVVAAVENMPDGKAYRPGDVITSMSGQTIEVLNTDAEGRMVLADALTWSERLNSQATVDIATLTGACVVALGHHASAVMTPHDDLAEELLSAGTSSADRAWRLPLWDDYQEQIDTPFADMKNIGGVPAGSITAGCFLSRFGKNQRWAHVDIAGSAWKWGSGKDGASGRPVTMLTQWLMDRAG